MKLKDMINQVIRLRGQQYEEDIMTGWINEIEAQAVEQVLSRGIGGGEVFEPYSWSKDQEKELLIPNRFCDVYQNYIFAKIDYLNQETERYNNDVSLFEASWQEFASWHIRTYQRKKGPSFRNF